MGYGYYTLPDGREAGYGVTATCDRDGCTQEIDRGLGHLCGDQPDGHREDSEPGCGRYFCGEHDADHDCPNPNGWDEDGNQKPYVEAGALARGWAVANEVPDAHAVVRMVAPIAGPVRFEYDDGREAWLLPVGN